MQISQMIPTIYQMKDHFIKNFPFYNFLFQRFDVTISLLDFRKYINSARKGMEPRGLTMPI